MSEQYNTERVDISARINILHSRISLLWAHVCSRHRRWARLLLPGRNRGSFLTCTDSNWVLRLRGLANWKKDQPYRVAVEYRGDSTWDSYGFRFGILASEAILSSRTLTARKHPSNRTNLEHNCSLVLHELARGKDAAKLTRKLTSRRVDKRNFLYHSTRTAHVASAGLRLGESMTIDDPVILLEGRRRLEIPLVLCRARAREAKSLCAGREVIISDPISWRSKNGASHRKNFDTPPLRGSCECTEVHFQRLQRHDNCRCT